MAKIPEILDKYIREKAQNLGYTIVDVVASGGRSTAIEITLDKEGGITLDECGSFNRSVISWIEENDDLSQKYTLDVCSPGIDRVLKSDNDFLWAKGKDIEVRTCEPVQDKKEFIGKLVEFSLEGKIFIETEDGNNITIEKDNVTKARLHVTIQHKRQG